MKKIEATKARQQFADTLNRVAYGRVRIVVRRRGKAIAAVVPVDDIALIKRCEEKESSPRKAGAPRGRKRGARRSKERKSRAA